MVTNTPLQKSGDSAGEYLPSGFCLLFIFVVLYCILFCDIFFVQFGITVLYVMIELLEY